MFVASISGSLSAFLNGLFVDRRGRLVAKYTGWLHLLHPPPIAAPSRTLRKSYILKIQEKHRLTRLCKLAQTVGHP